MQRYIADVVPVTEEEVLSSLAAVYVSVTAPDYYAGGTGSSAEASDVEYRRLEWLALHEWGRVVTWRDYRLARKSRFLRLLPTLSRMSDLTGDICRPIRCFPVSPSYVGVTPGNALPFL